MRRKATILAILAILLTAATAGNRPAYTRVISSMHSIQRNFGELKNAGTLNTVERLVFSLVLSNAKAPATATDSRLPAGGT